MDAIAPRPRALPARITGRPFRWGRDLSLIGGVTTASAMLAAGTLGSVFGLVAVSTAVVAGFVLGLEMPSFLDSTRHRLPLALVGLRVIAVGGSLGGFVGLLSSLAAGNPWFLGPLVVGALAGALQLGWWWLPYTVLTVTERPTWPAVLVACGVAPLVGPLAQALASFLASLVI